MNKVGIYFIVLVVSSMQMCFASVVLRPIQNKVEQKEVTLPVAEKSASVESIDSGSQSVLVQTNTVDVSGDMQAQLAVLLEQVKQVEIVLNQLRTPEYNPFYEKESIAAYNFKTVPLQGKEKMPRMHGIASCTKEARKDNTDQKNGRSVVRYTVIPEKQTDTDTVILLKVVHGTFSDPEKYASKSLNDFGRSIIIFAQQLALAYAAQIHLDIFGWSGKLDSAQRMRSGQTLAKEIFEETQSVVQQNKKMIVWALGHSHGCNVIHKAAQTLKEEKYFIRGERIAIDNAVLLASPILDIDPEKTKDKSYNIHSVLHFYGNADTTARLGSMQSTLEQIFTGKRKIFEKSCPLHKAHSCSDVEWVRNIRVKCNGMQTDHIHIAAVVIRFLGDMLYQLGKDFPLFYDLVLNLYPAKTEFAYYRPQVAIAQSDKSWEIIKYAPQYLGLMPKNVRDAMQQSVQVSEQTVKDYAKRYSKQGQTTSLYDKGIVLGDVLSMWNKLWKIDPYAPILYGY